MLLAPRIHQDEIDYYASRYVDPLEKSIENLVSNVRDRGFLTKQDLITIGDWKSPRIRPHIAKNSEKEIRDATRLALETKSVSLAVHIPQCLRGVGMPVASTLLHWFHKDLFPILDFRALWSLNVDKPQDYTLGFWVEYVETFRHLCDTYQVDKRSLDKALWQYSKENQPSDSE